MDLQERWQVERRIAEARKAARRDYVRYSEESAVADLEYRKTKAIKLVEYRSEGEPAGVAEVRAEADAAGHKHKRDIAASMAKAALLRVDESERESVVVRDLHATSERIDGLTP
jgi:hypothetical protein